MASRHDDFYSSNPNHWSHPAPWNAGRQKMLTDFIFSDYKWYRDLVGGEWCGYHVSYFYEHWNRGLKPHTPFYFGSLSIEKQLPV